MIFSKSYYFYVAKKEQENSFHANARPNIRRVLRSLYTFTKFHPVVHNRFFVDGNADVVGGGWWWQIYYVSRKIKFLRSFYGRARPVDA